MSKSIKLKDNNYLGTESIMYNRTRLDNLLCGDQAYESGYTILTNTSVWQLLKCELS